MDDLAEHVERSIGEHKLLRPGQSCLVAVSGGLDSMVLLHLIAGLAPKYRWKLKVAHFNHRLRGRSSDGDQHLVERTSARLRLQCFAGAGEVRVFAKKRGISIEMAARELRHEFLAWSVQKSGADRLAVAHHADDQVELFYLRLFRGAGPEGLSGMKWQSPSPVDKRVIIIRPLLDCSREQLELYARKHRIAFREDASNDTSDFLRNQIRNELLPLLQKSYQPAVRGNTLRAMELIRAESDYVADQARESVGLKGKQFADLPLALRRRRLIFQLVEQGIQPAYDLVERLLSDESKEFALDPQRMISLNSKGIIELRRIPQVVPFEPPKAITLRGTTGTATFGPLTVIWRLYPGNNYRTGANTEWFDADKVGADIVLRHWQSGDRLIPLGMTKSVKLQDLFVNCRIPRARRHELAVATTSRGEIFWVEGLRISERFKLDKDTQRRLKWTWKRPDKGRI